MLLVRWVLSEPILRILKDKLHTLSPLPRRVIPDGHRPVCLNCHSDGSLFLASYVMFMTSTNTETNSTTSWNCGAGCKIKQHSIPAMELCRGLAVTEASSEYIWKHIESIFPNNHPPLFQVKIGLDSDCVLWTLHPEKPQKSILVRN